MTDKPLQVLRLDPDPQRLQHEGKAGADDRFKVGDRVQNKRGWGTVERIVRELDGTPTAVLMVVFDGEDSARVCCVEQFQRPSGTKGDGE